MKKYARPLVLLVIAGVAALVVANVNNNRAEEQRAEEEAATQQAEEQKQAEQEAEEKAVEEEKASYSFVAQSGDSWTKLARKAVQTFGIRNNVSLSEAQIVAAETFLTSDAGFPDLNLGQEVELSPEVVKAAVEKAQALDEAAVARWQKYVPYVDFNTDHVGQSAN